MLHTLHTFMPTDRAHALVAGHGLPARATGIALFADIAGFTPLAESLRAAHGTQRGAELLASTIEVTFGAIGEAVHEHGGSVVAFAGDALTCWFAGDAADQAVAAALQMQQLVATSGTVMAPGGDIQLGLKVGVAAGDCTRVIVGDPGVQQFDVASGDAIDRCAAAEKFAGRGEVVVDARVEAALAGRLGIAEHRDGHAVVTALDVAPDPVPWPHLEESALSANQCSQWVQATVFERLTASDEPLLAEFRPVAPVFVGVDGIDHDQPTDVAELDRIVRQTQAAATQHGGVVLGVLTGDKGTFLVLAFGAPVTHGDDGRRAVAAAQELRTAFGDRVRIGVHAGRVFAGLFRGEVFSTYSFIGDVANTAARLMGAARPGQVLVGAPAARELDRRFQLDPLEPLQLKGLDAPVAVSELLPAAAAISHALSEPRYELPLVGRERERRTITDALDRARTGQGAVLSIVADPGMGKSRLLTAAIGDAVRRGFAVVAGECQPHGTASPYLPWQPILHELLGVPFGAPDEVRAGALHAALQAGAPQAVPLAPLLGEALDLDVPETDVTRQMPTPVRRQVRHDVLAGVLQARAAAGPLCIVIEDLHWIDSSSRDLLQDLTPLLAGLPVLVLVALRPLELGDRIEMPAGEVVELDELDIQAAERLTIRLLEHLGEGPADPDDVAAVLERAGGNPFFIEELAREVSTGSATELPTSIEGLILHRIDQLAERRQRTLRMASIIGRRFATDVLRGAYADTLESGELPADLDGLAESGLVRVETPEPDEAYLFRHALVRDVAYETLSYGLRERLHEQVAAFLEASVENPAVELLAFHYARTANTAKEGHYRRLAAERAIRAGAFVDAREHLDRAMEILATQDQAPSALAEELELQLLRGTTLQMLHGQSSPVAKTAYDRARELTQVLPPGPDTGRAVFGLWAYYLFQGQMGPAAELADEAVGLAQHAPDPSLQVMAQLTVSQTHFWTGEFDKHETATQAVYAGYDPALHESYVTQYTQNPRFTAASGYITSLWQLGRLDDALAEVARGRADGDALAHPFSLALIETNLPVLAYCRGLEHEAVQEAAERLLELAGQIGNPVYIAWAQTNLGYAAVLRGEHDAGIAQMEAQLEATTRLEAYLFDPLLVALLADAMRRAGRFDDGLVLLDRMTPVFAEGGRVTWACEHAKLRAELLLGRDPAATDEALALLDEAVAIARSHGTVGSELRAALVRAGLLRQLGHDNWRDDLADVLVRLPQGHDDPVPTAARELLAG